MMSLIRRFGTQRSGATSIEYAIIAGVIAIAIVAGATNIGTNLTPKYAAIATNLK